jgi:hypothetical protein
VRTERIFTSCFQIYRIFSLLTTNPAKIPRNPHTKKTTLQSNVPDELPDSLSSSIFYEKEREYSGFEYLNGDYYLIRHKKSMTEVHPFISTLLMKSTQISLSSKRLGSKFCVCFHFKPKTCDCTTVTNIQDYLAH